MKRLIIFTGLKLAEILGVCGIFAILCGLAIGYRWFRIYLRSDTSISIFLYYITLSLFISFLGYGIYQIIKANWAWAGRINKGKK